MSARGTWHATRRAAALTAVDHVAAVADVQRSQRQRVLAILALTGLEVRAIGDRIRHFRHNICVTIS